jgi:DNA-binding PadR family transcriptional regulator
MDLSPTAYVVLGFLAWRPMSGYEIKGLVDKSTRLFWTASYGQIYPELRRLAEDGLVTGTDSPTGGRKRTVYSLTAKGRTALEKWLAEEPETYETRDEGLLKLFFADATGEQSAADILAAKQRHHEEIVAHLREIEPSGENGDPESFSHLVLRYGIECNRLLAGWCERERRRIEAGKATGRST